MTRKTDEMEVSIKRPDAQELKFCRAVDAHTGKMLESAAVQRWITQMEERLGGPALLQLVSNRAQALPEDARMYRTYAASSKPGGAAYELLDGFIYSADFIEVILTGTDITAVLPWKIDSDGGAGAVRRSIREGSQMLVSTTYTASGDAQIEAIVIGLPED